MTSNEEALQSGDPVKVSAARSNVKGQLTKVVNILKPLLDQNVKVVSRTKVLTHRNNLKI